ncbi:globin-like protein, partial [Pelagophyceae sp. CCMP2097]
APPVASTARVQDEPDLYNSAALKKHALSVMQTVGKAVAALTSGLDAIVPVLRSLRMRHKGYGVLEAHYAVVGAALLATLQGGLGSAWNEVLAEAWAQTYSIVSQTM